jgi:hypothetical protein
VLIIPCFLLELPRSWGASICLTLHSLNASVADLFTYYGYKFEALCTGDDDVVDSTSEFALLLKLRLGQHTLLMAAEVDCLNPEAVTENVPFEGPLSTEQFLELKTVK